MDRCDVEWFDPGKAHVGRPRARATRDELEITLVKTAVAVAVAKVEVDYSTDSTDKEAWKGNYGKRGGGWGCVIC
jgi:hypothetical protein